MCFQITPTQLLSSDCQNFSTKINIFIFPTTSLLTFWPALLPQGIPTSLLLRKEACAALWGGPLFRLLACGGLVRIFFGWIFFHETQYTDSGEMHIPSGVVGRRAGVGRSAVQGGSGYVVP